MIWFFFFFSSRRRHTRLQGDWSSDVCSSDLCATVMVDVERSAPVEAPEPRILYPERAPVEQEIGPAKTAYSNSRVLMRDVVSAVRIGRALDAGRLKSAINSMTESVLRNPDALLLFSQLRAKGEYTESHALDVSIYMITF